MSKGFEPAVPFPVIAPGDVEERAIQELHARLSSVDVGATLARIEREAAEAKAAREKSNVVTSIEQQVAAEREAQEKFKQAKAELARLKRQQARARKA